MTLEPEIIQPKVQPIALLHTLVFPDVLESKRSVSDRRGYLVAGPDRRGMNALSPITLWRTWQNDVQSALQLPGAWHVPAKVQDYFERTKHLQSPPKGDLPIEVYGSNPSMIKEAIIFNESEILQEAPPTMLDLGLNLDSLAPTPAAPIVGPCQGKLANPPRFATSFTGMERFLQCPFQWAAEKYYKTVPYEETVHTIWGNRVHKTAENYMLNALDVRAGKASANRPLEDECLALVKRYCDFFLSIPGAEIHVEKELCCTKDLKVCGWKDWNTVWFRGKGDLLIIKDRKLIIPDWKTGKKKDDTFQIEVMVALADLYFGDKFDTADGKLIFLKESDPKNALVSLPKPITKADIPGIWERIFAITNRMQEAWDTANFRMQKNGLCKQYCGNLHCIHNGRR